MGFDVFESRSVRLKPALCWQEDGGRASDAGITTLGRPALPLLLR